MAVYSRFSVDSNRDILRYICIYVKHYLFVLDRRSTFVEAIYESELSDNKFLPLTPSIGLISSAFNDKPSGPLKEA